MESKAEQFARDGYIVLDNLFNEDELASAIKKVVVSANNKWALATNPYKKEDGSLELDSYYTPLLPKFKDECARRMGDATNAAKAATYMCYVFVRTNSAEIDKPFRDLVRSKMSLISEVTGEPLNDFFSAFTSCYEQGCFLTPHTDEFKEVEHEPQIAFVLNLTKEWRWWWGGLLHLLDESPWQNGEVIKVIKPTYNSLTIFKLPRWHYVSEVANCAAEKRLAFTGWLNFIPETS